MCGILLFLIYNSQQSSMIGSTTIQSQGVIYLVVAKLQVDTAVSFRFVSAYVILERPRKSGVQWWVRHTPFAADRSQNVSEFHRASDSRWFVLIGIQKHDFWTYSRGHQEKRNKLSSHWNFIVQIRLNVITKIFLTIFVVSILYTERTILL